MLRLHQLIEHRVSGGPRAAHDVVPAQLPNRAPHPTSPEALGQIAFGDLFVFRQGAPTHVSAEKAREPLRAKEVTLNIYLNAGKSTGVYWTCDFTGQYVDINARYRT